MILQGLRTFSIVREVVAGQTSISGITSWQMPLTSCQDPDLSWAAGRSPPLQVFIAAFHLPPCSTLIMPIYNRCSFRSARTLLAIPMWASARTGPGWVRWPAGLIPMHLRYRLPVSLGMPDEISCGARHSRNSTQRCTRILRSLADERLRLEQRLITSSTARILESQVIHKVRFPWEATGMPSSRMRRGISPLTQVKSSPPPAPRARFNWPAGFRSEGRRKPMAATSEYVLEPIRDRAEFTLYRARRRDNSMPFLAVAPSAEPPPPQTLRRLEHEYSLAAQLELAWAAQPLALTRQEGRTILVLADPGGEPLDRVLARDRKQPLDLARFLRLAINLATAIGSAHQRGLIHKDVKPENVLIDNADRVWLIGFGIASVLPRERQAPAPPEIIAGTLAYMSPEQTGRMNRSVDTRSDLYSLGVTFYEMLTGVLPFAAADPLEWVHCHIARQPVTPIDRRAVPEPLSAIIMKLLAKNAEERYQTATGLEADLRRCLTEWQSSGRINPFPLGADDSPDRLLIPERLYGREREVDTLLAAFDRVVAQGAVEVVLVSGYSGVSELHKVLVPSRGLFAAGKFDQYKRDVPYATLAQAFQMLVRQILVKSEAEVDHWRLVLLQALGSNGQLMVSLIPEVEFIIGKQPPVAELPPQEARNRFQLVFRRFLGAFARPEHPLALFLDDLQWLDTATLELLECMVTDPVVRHVLLIGAYRDNEVSSSHPLIRTLTAIRDAGARPQEILLAPLGLDDVERLIADALQCGLDSAGPLALLVYEKTGGNPFFAIQFLMALAEEELLRFDRKSAAWIWELSRSQARRYSDNVVDLMLGKLRRLPHQTQTALQQFACLGNVADM